MLHQMILTARSDESALVRRYRRPLRRPLGLQEAPWLGGRVPSGYWADIRNRRRYLRWLGQHLGFTKPDDWYQISTGLILGNYGGGALVRWNHSAVAAVKELFPNREWHEWLFEQAPLRFWKDPRNHRRYLDWLGKQLKIKRFEDWYHVTNKDFAEHAGSSFLMEHRSTISRALMTCFPEYEWKEWMFDQTPSRFWSSPKNRRKYLRWLGQHLGYSRPTDWYSLSLEILQANYGRGLIRNPRRSIVSAVRELFPRRTWHEWLFQRVPAGFWKKKSNRRAYLDWLGRELKIKRPEDWLQVRMTELKERKGGSFLTEFNQVEMLEEYLPQLNCRKRRVTRPLERTQILAWADAHFSRIGQWPRKGSGRIKGTSETWYNIDNTLFRGLRGLPGGMRLAELLAAERGARNRNCLPPLTIEQIRTWVMAWHERTGRWPNCRSGPIPDSGGETWAAVAIALSRGKRGFARGNTLERFVALVRESNV